MVGFGINKKLAAENRSKLRSIQSKNLPPVPKFNPIAAGHTELPGWVIDDLYSSIPQWAIDDSSADALIRANIRYADGNEARAIGGVGDRTISAKARSVEAGIWFAVGQTIDGELVAPTDWKPLKPVIGEDGKPRKYDGRYGSESVPYLAQVPWLIGQRVADRYGLGSEYRARQGEAGDHEVDHGFWAWVESQPAIEVAIGEGVKKDFALMLHGIPVVACKGAYNWHPLGNAHVLHEAIERLTKDRPCLTVFDRDSKEKTIRQVWDQIRKLGKCLDRNGSQPFTLLWDPDAGKGIDDFLVSSLDSREELNALLDARYTLPEAAKELFEKDLSPVEKRDREIRKRDWVFDTNYANGLKRDYLLSRWDHEYEGYAPTFPIEHRKTTALQGGLGSGKTEAMLRSIALANPGKTVIWTTTRNGLLHQVRARAHKHGNVHIWHYQSDVSGIREQLEMETQGHSEGGSFVTMAIDSLKPYAVGNLDWQNVILVIDEFSSVRREVLSKSQEFPQFERALSEAGTLIIADAHLSDIDIAILEQYRPGTLEIYRQKPKKSTKRVTWVESKTADDRISFQHEGAYGTILTQFLENYLNIPGYKFAIATDSLLTANIAADYLRTRSPKLQIKLTTSEAPAENLDFLANPDGILADESIDCWIYTPSAEAGIDVQTPFDDGLMISCGVLPPLSMLQMMGRCRQCEHWYISAPRFSAEAAENPVSLDDRRLTGWAKQIEATYRDLEIPTSDRSGVWGMWQESVRNIERAFNGEYLRHLLDHYFEAVETEVFEYVSFATGIWRKLQQKVKYDQMVETLGADLAIGRELLKNRKQPKTRSEVFAVKLADMDQKFPKLSADLIAAFGSSDSQAKEDAIAMGLALTQRRMRGLKNWVLASQIDDGEAIEQLRGYGFVNFASPKWRAYTMGTLFRRLRLERLSKLEKDGEVKPHETGFTADSPIVAELWQAFNADPHLQKICPQIDSKAALWRACCRCMKFHGFRSVGYRIRQASDRQTKNGYDRNGKPRYVSTKVVYFSAWLLMEESGSEFFREHFWQIVEAITEWVQRELEQDRKYRDARQKPEPVWEVAA